MADILPFRGVRYNQAIAGDLSRTICPPYDIISPHMQSELYARSDYNFVRIEHPEGLHRDNAVENKYTRAATTLTKWLGQGVLIADEAPAIYLHDHCFLYRGQEYRRRGIIALVRLEEWESRVIRPHEGTLSTPKSDRLTLLRALQANTSPILALFEDRQRQIASVLATRAKGEPFLHFHTEDGEEHSLWAINDAEMLDQIQRTLAHQPLYIADGHHRYESALAYRRERRHNLAKPPGNGNEGYDFVMMTLVDFADPGLVILPPHRLVRNLPTPKIEEMVSKINSLFETEELSLSSPIWQKVNAFLGGEAGQGRIALCRAGEKNMLLLKPRDLTSVEKFMPASRSEHYRKLTVSILDHVILEKLLGLRGEEAEALTYSYDQSDAANMVLSGEYQLAFLIGPVNADAIKMIADVGDRMPRKSTYFYPKLPSGLVFYRMS